MLVTAEPSLCFRLTPFYNPREPRTEFGSLAILTEKVQDVSTYHMLGMRLQDAPAIDGHGREARI